MATRSWYGYTGPESPAEYLQNEIFPTLLPAMEKMLRVAMATERRKRFNSLDYLTEYLYQHNPNHKGRDGIPLHQIPFVMEEWSVNPRPPLPLSATLTEEEAAIIIQSHYRGYRVRREPKAQLFRTWQKKVHQERLAAEKIKTFMKKVSSTVRPNLNRRSRQEVREQGRRATVAVLHEQEEIQEEEEEELKDLPPQGVYRRRNQTLRRRVTDTAILEQDFLEEQTTRRRVTDTALLEQELPDEQS